MLAMAVRFMRGKKSMTRDEALKKMQAVKSYMTSGNPIWSVTEIGEAFDMAIEALEQPERKTGKWIIEPYDAQNDIFIHRCGTCMRVAMLGGHTTKFKYCPICGSAMEGE